MSKHAEQIGRLKTKARVIILREDLCEALSDVANGLVLVGKARAGTPPPPNTKNDIAHAAIHKCVDRFSEELWGRLPFVLNSFEGVKQFCVKLEAAYSVKSDAIVEKHFGPSKENLSTHL